MSLVYLWPVLWQVAGSVSFSLWLLASPFGMLVLKGVSQQCVRRFYQPLVFEGVEDWHYLVTASCM
jgi:hypothetical protein